MKAVTAGDKNVGKKVRGEEMGIRRMIRKLRTMFQ